MWKRRGNEIVTRVSYGGHPRKSLFSRTERKLAFGRVDVEPHTRSHSHVIFNEQLILPFGPLDDVSRVAVSHVFDSDEWRRSYYNTQHYICSISTDEREGVNVPTDRIINFLDTAESFRLHRLGFDRTRP